MSLLTSRRLIVSSMLLREQYKRLEKRFPPSYVQKLVRTTRVPLPLKYKLHPTDGPVSLLKPHPEPLEPLV